MPRYYFDFQDAESVTIDETGEELPTIERARKEALRAVGEAARDFSRQRGAGVLAVEVRDDSGPILRVSATIEITALSKTFPEEA
jgi:hypothetical protein